MFRAPLFIAHTNNKNMATASPFTEILACFTACTPARGRHQLRFLPNERGAFSPSANKTWTAVIDVEIIVRRSMRWRALKICLITTEEGPTKVQFRE